MTDYATAEVKKNKRVGCQVMLGVFAVLVLWSYATSEKPKPAPKAKELPPISVTAAKLSRDFASNILKAEKTYGGRHVKVSGFLDYFSKSGSTISLRFFIPGVPGVEASLDEGHYAGLENVEPRNWMTLLCESVEEGPITPKLKDCTLIPAEAP